MSENLTAVITGSGMSGIVRRFATSRVASFADIEGVGDTDVVGHLGEVHRVADAPWLMVVGRCHGYEQRGGAMVRLLQWLRDRGATRVLSISAVGGIGHCQTPGTLVSIRRIRDQGTLRAEAMSACDRATFGDIRGQRAGITRDFAREIEAAASAAGVAMMRGTMVTNVGPAYETAAEVEALARSGTDVVGMSSALEVSVAQTLGMQAGVIAVVTNPAAGLASADLSHREVVSVASHQTQHLAMVISQLVVNKPVAR